MTSRWITALAFVALQGTALAQGDYHGRKAWSLNNGKLNVVVTPGGGHIASMTLDSGRGSGLNPLWLPPWKSVEPGGWKGGAYGDPPGAQLLCCILGHNICLDFFGAPSKQETAAGIPVHGEAPCVNWTAGSKSANRITYSTTLPAAQMRVSRTISMAPNSTAIWISETVENLSPLDRPYGWNQHVTLGNPFLKSGESFFDFSGSWSMVYPKEFSKGERLQRGSEFEWPEATARDGAPIDMRGYPTSKKNSDFTTTLAKEGKWAWFTAVNVKKGLLIGYIWPRNMWPWIDNWEENHFRSGNPWKGRAVARGVEFGTTPWPDSRREMVTLNKLHGTSTYRWLPARGKETAGYAAFLAPIPPGTRGVKEVDLTGNKITIDLDGVEKSISLTIRK